MKLVSTYHILSLLLYQGVYSSSPFPSPSGYSGDGNDGAVKFVAENEYPWFSKVIVDKYFYECSGTLIAPDFVLTTAECINREVFNKGYIEVGTLCKRTENCGQKYESFGIKKIWIQSPYDDSSNDIALIQLDSLSTITPANINLSGLVQSYSDLNEKYLLTMGMGETKDGAQHSWRLKKSIGKYISQDECKSIFGDAETITSNSICVKSKNNGHCIGDQGGPLYDKEKDAVVGVISNSRYECDSDYPYLTNRLAGSSHFIKQTICKNSQAGKLGKYKGYCKKGRGEKKYTKLVIDIVTDSNAAGKKSWFNIKMGKRDGSKMKIKYERLLENNEPVQFTYFLKTNRCYIFSLFDTNGDGLVGGGRGYRVIYDTEIIVDSFFTSGFAWHRFGDCLSSD